MATNKTPTPRPNEPRQELPNPLPPRSQIKLLAAQFRNCIERNMNPRTLADLALPAQGEAFVYAASKVSPEESLASFKADGEAWQHLEAVSEKLKPFLEKFIARCKEIVEEQGIWPPGEIPPKIEARPAEPAPPIEIPLEGVKVFPKEPTQ